MRPSALILALAAVLSAAPAAAQQQMVDPDFRPVVARPAHASDGPRVVIDGAHHNFHTVDGQYAPFAALLRADGYEVRAGTAAFDAGGLDEVDVLVIANAGAVHEPTGPIFTGAEIAAVEAWVRNGGRLLLIADHAPFGAAAEPLAAAFGVRMGKGYAFAITTGGSVTTNLVYPPEAFGAHPIMTGGGAEERVESVTAFTGQSLAGPAGATCSADDVAQLLASSPQFRAQLVEMLVAGHGEALRGPQGERGAVGESGLQGEPGERGEQGAAGMSAQQLYAFNGHGDAIGWVTSVDDSGYIIYIEQDDVFYRIPTGLGGWGVRNVRIYYDSLNCTGTPYINEPPRRLTNVDGSGFYRTTNVGWQVMIPQSTLSPDGICGPGSGGMEIYVTMAEQVQRPDYLIGPFTIGR